MARVKNKDQQATPSRPFAGPELAFFQKLSHLNPKKEPGKTLGEIYRRTSNAEFSLRFFFLYLDNYREDGDYRAIINPIRRKEAEKLSPFDFVEMFAQKISFTPVFKMAYNPSGSNYTTVIPHQVDALSCFSDYYSLSQEGFFLKWVYQFIGGMRAATLFSHAKKDDKGRLRINDRFILKDQTEYNIIFSDESEYTCSFPVLVSASKGLAEIFNSINKSPGLFLRKLLKEKTIISREGHDIYPVYVIMDKKRQNITEEAAAGINRQALLFKQKLSEFNPFTPAGIYGVLDELYHNLGMDPVHAMNTFYLYRANYRPDGDYEKITRFNEPEKKVTEGSDLGVLYLREFGLRVVKDLSFPVDGNMPVVPHAIDDDEFQHDFKSMSDREFLSKWKKYFSRDYSDPRYNKFYDKDGNLIKPVTIYTGTKFQFKDYSYLIVASNGYIFKHAQPESLAKVFEKLFASDVIENDLAPVFDEDELLEGKNKVTIIKEETSKKFNRTEIGFLKRLSTFGRPDNKEVSLKIFEVMKILGMSADQQVAYYVLLKDNYRADGKYEETENPIRRPFTDDTGIMEMMDSLITYKNIYYWLEIGADDIQLSAYDPEERQMIDDLETLDTKVFFHKWKEELEDYTEGLVDIGDVEDEEGEEDDDYMNDNIPSLHGPNMQIRFVDGSEFNYDSLSFDGADSDYGLATFFEWYTREDDLEHFALLLIGKRAFMGESVEKKTSEPFNRTELGFIKRLHSIGNPNNKADIPRIFRFLNKMISFDTKESLRLFFLYRDNYREDREYEKIKVPVRTNVDSRLDILAFVKKFALKVDILYDLMYDYDSYNLDMAREKDRLILNDFYHMSTKAFMLKWCRELFGVGIKPDDFYSPPHISDPTMCIEFIDGSTYDYYADGSSDNSGGYLAQTFDRMAGDVIYMDTFIRNMAIGDDILTESFRRPSSTLGRAKIGILNRLYNEFSLRELDRETKHEIYDYLTDFFGLDRESALELALIYIDNFHKGVDFSNAGYQEYWDYRDMKTPKDFIMKYGWKIAEWGAWHPEVDIERQGWRISIYFIDDSVAVWQLYTSDIEVLNGGLAQAFSEKVNADYTSIEDYFEEVYFGVEDGIYNELLTYEG